MQILLTGHKGFIGKTIHEKLKTKYAINCFDCGTSFDDWVKDFRQYLELYRCDLIIHCGAVSDSTETGQHLWEMNFDTTRYLARYAKTINAKFLFFSSCAAIDPKTDYGRSKQAAEYALKLKLNSENLCILRPFNVWGFNETGKSNPSIVYKLLNNKLEQIYAPCVRDFVNVDDVVSAVQTLIDDWKHGTFEIGTGIGTPIKELGYALYADNPIIIPHIIDECPIAERLVADPQRMLPNWSAKAINDILFIKSVR